MLAVPALTPAPGTPKDPVPPASSAVLGVPSKPSGARKPIPIGAGALRAQAMPLPEPLAETRYVTSPSDGPFGTPRPFGSVVEFFSTPWSTKKSASRPFTPSAQPLPSFWIVPPV